MGKPAITENRMGYEESATAAIRVFPARVEWPHRYAASYAGIQTVRRTVYCCGRHARSRRNCCSRRASWIATGCFVSLRHLAPHRRNYYLLRHDNQRLKRRPLRPRTTSTVCRALPMRYIPNRTRATARSRATTSVVKNGTEITSSAPAFNISQISDRRRSGLKTTTGRPCVVESF